MNKSMKNTPSTTAIQAQESLTPKQEKKRAKGKKQGGFNTMDFMFWMAFAALALAALMSVYTAATEASKKSTTVNDVVQIKAAADSWRGQRNSLTGVSIEELCKVGYGNSKATWCDANKYGGKYTVAQGTTIPTQAIISMSKINPEFILSLANELAPMSADRCASYAVANEGGAGGCKTTTVAGDVVTVTM